MADPVGVFTHDDEREALWAWCEDTIIDAERACTAARQAIEESRKLRAATLELLNAARSPDGVAGKGAASDAASNGQAETW